LRIIGLLLVVIDFAINKTLRPNINHSMLIKIKGFLLLTLFVTIVLEIETKVIEYPSVVSIGIEEGLSNNSVRCISKDKKGFMWLNTDDNINQTAMPCGFNDVR
jgi:hypothetical protein